MPDACDHRAHIGILRRWRALELGSAGCPACGADVGYPRGAAALADFAVLLTFVFSAAVSIQVRGYWPYGSVVLAYLAGRAWIVGRCAMVATTRARLQLLAWALLVAFVWLLLRNF